MQPVSSASKVTNHFWERKNMQPAPSAGKQVRLRLSFSRNRLVEERSFLWLLWACCMCCLLLNLVLHTHILFISDMASCILVQKAFMQLNTEKQTWTVTTEGIKNCLALYNFQNCGVFCISPSLSVVLIVVNISLLNRNFMCSCPRQFFFLLVQPQGKTEQVIKSLLRSVRYY